MSKFKLIPLGPPPPPLAPAQGSFDPKAGLIGRALGLLARTDFVVIKAAEGAASLRPEWLAWRESLRAVVRGNATEIPPEPERYNAP